MKFRCKLSHPSNFNPSFNEPISSAASISGFQHHHKFSLGKYPYKRVFTLIKCLFHYFLCDFMEDFYFNSGSKHFS